MQNRNFWIYVVGEVEYEDIFGKLRVRAYCLKISRIIEHDKVPSLEALTFMRNGGRAYNQCRDQDWAARD